MVPHLVEYERVVVTMGRNKHRRETTFKKSIHAEHLRPMAYENKLGKKQEVAGIAANDVH